jgi:predicted ATPase
VSGSEPAAGRPHNLPRALTSFVGRETEVAEVRRLLGVAPLVSLTGPGGSGKTRLALRVAAEVLAAPDPVLRDGVWLVDLAPLADGTLVPQAVAAAVGVREVPGQPLAAILAGALRARRLLLVLDNCEPLLDACAVLAETLLRAAPGVRILATSREPLRGGGEAVFRVPPLAAPDPSREEPLERLATYPAVRLFVARARQAQPAFKLDGVNAGAVVRICRRLDGMPLAIELAAARTRTLPPAQLAARLDDRLGPLAAGDRTARRQQIVRAVLDWSHDLLSASEAALFRRLAVFAGGWTAAAAGAVGPDGTSGSVAHPGGATAVGGPAGVLELLTALVDRSLVLAETGAPAPDAGAASGARYRLLEPVRQYAAERLAASGEGLRARAAHARYVLALAEAAAEQLQGPQQGAWHAVLEAEHDNLRAALSWWVQTGDAERALRLAVALRWFWYRRRHWDEGFGLPSRVLAMPGAQAPTLRRAIVLEGAALFAMWRDPATAEAMWEESIAISLEIGQPARTAQTHAYLAWLDVRRGRLEAAQVQAAAALALSEAAADAGGRANALALLGAVAARRGEHALAREHHEAALTLRRASGNVSSRSLLLLEMAKAAFLAGDGPLARARAEEALETARAAGIRQGVEEDLRLIVRVALDAGDVVAATGRAAELVAHVRGRGTAAEADALPLLGQALHAAGDAAGAAARYRATVELVQRLPDPGEVHPTLVRDANDPPGAALALEGTARLVAAAQPALALRLAAAAAILRRRTQQPLTAAEAAALERPLAGARDRLGPAAAVLDGASQTAPLEATLALALAALEALAPPS